MNLKKYLGMNYSKKILETETDEEDIPLLNQENTTSRMLFWRHINCCSKHSDDNNTIDTNYQRAENF